MTFSSSTTRRSKFTLAGACALAFGLSTSAGYAQIINPTNLGSGDPLQRGVGEALRSGTQGGTIGESLRRGVGEAVQSAVETPGQTLQRDQQLRWQQQVDAQQRGQFTQPGNIAVNPQGNIPYGTGTLYQDQQGRSYYLDNLGRRVFTQPQAYGQVQTYGQVQGYGQMQPGYSQPQGVRQPSATVRSSMQASGPQGATLGVSIEPADQGVRVLNVRSGSAAEQAGLRRDDIIRRVNGQDIVGVQSLIQSVNSTADGRLEIEIERNGQQEQMVATVSSSDASYRMAKPAIDDGRQGTSEEVRSLKSQLTQLQEDFEALRQEVMSLKTSSDETEPSRDTLPTPPSTPSPEPGLFDDTTADQNK